MNQSQNLTGFQGSLEGLAHSIQFSFPKFLNFLTKTYLPLVDATFIRLFGNYNAFTKEAANFSLNLSNQGIVEGITVNFSYSIPEIKSTFPENEDIQKDKQFILNSVGQLAQNVEVNPAAVRIDTKNGRILITALFKGF